MNEYQKVKKHLLKNIDNFSVSDLQTLIELNYEKIDDPKDRVRVLIFNMSCKELLKRINDNCPIATAKRIHFENKKI